MNEIIESQTPLISVLLPVFRAESVSLRQSVDSILNQSLGDFELLLLYEVSPDDGLEEVFREYKDIRIRLVTLTEKTGLPRSLNKGLDIARGKYIARMDADDIAAVDRFEKQYRHMEEHPEIDILGGVIRVMGTDTRMFDTLPLPEARGVRMMFENAGIAHPTAFYRRESLDRVNLRYDESLKGSEDYRLWAEAVLAGLKIDSVKDVVLFFRIHDSQASNRLSEEMIRWDDETRRHMWEQLAELSEQEIKVLESFTRYRIYEYKAKEYESALGKLIAGNREKHIYKQETLRKEITWQWMRHVVYNLRHYHSMSLLVSVASLRAIIPERLIYCVKQAHDLHNSRR